MNQREPSFIGLIAACLMFPIIIPILLLVAVRKIVLGALRWTLS